MKLKAAAGAAALAIVAATATAQAQLGQTPPQIVGPVDETTKFKETLTRDTPVITRLRINAGAQFTANRVVVLDIDLGANASRVTQYRASERADLSDAQWLPFQPRPSFNVSIGNGQKTIYLQVRGRTNILTPATRDGFASSRIASDAIIFANPRLVDVVLENGAGFSHDATVSAKVTYEGSANLYRVSDRNDFEGVNWRNLSGTTFNFTFPGGASNFPGVSNRRTVYVQIANGPDYISDTVGREIDLVRATTHTVPLGPALDEARAENYVVSATSRNGEWICEFGRAPGSDFADLRATPSAHLAGTGYAGSDTCTFRIFEGRKLKAPWLLREFTYVGGTVEGEGIPVTVDAPTALSNDAGMTITWSMPATGILPTTYHRGFLGELKLVGPENGDRREVLDHERELAEHYQAVLRLARQYGQSYNEFSLHFRLRLHLEWEGGVLGFPWYDTLDQMEQLFDWLLSAADGDDWSDVEQGWEMIAVRIASRFHFREGGFDQGGEYVNVALPRDPLLLSVSNLRERVRLIVARLTAEIGEDYWTRHRYDLRADLDMKS